ncbi:MAG: SAF domain-containing protein [Jiangellaceae bacterium]
MVRTDTDSVSTRSAALGHDVSSPQAARLARSRWLDPRLVTGLLLVLGSVVVGTRVIAAADETVPVLVAATDLAPGQPLSAAMVETRQVRLEGTLDLYHTGEVGDGYVVVRPVSAGELVPRSAVGVAGDTDAVRYVTVAVPVAELPLGLGPAAVVDVWRAPPAQGEDRTADRLMAGVSVTAVDAGGGGLAGSGSVARVTLAVATDARGGLDEAVAGLVAAGRDGLVYLVRVPETPR